MTRDPRDERLRVARSRHPGAEAFVRWSPGRVLRRMSFDPLVLERLRAFLLVVTTGLALNYAYYESFSLHHLFIGGIQDWFTAFQALLDGAVGQGDPYNFVYVLVNGIYYFFLVKLGIALMEAVLYSSRPFFNAAMLTAVFVVAYYVDSRWGQLLAWAKSLLASMSAGAT